MKSKIYELTFGKINVRAKKLFAVALVLFFSLSANAQDSDKSMHFGLKAEPSFAWLKIKEPNGPALEGDGSKIGFAFGLMTEFSLSSNYSFATGLDVAYRGGKVKSLVVTDLVHTTGTTDDSLRTLTSSDIMLQYIEVPLTLKMKTNEIGYFTYFGQFGVAPGFNISAKADNHIEKQAVNVNGNPKDLPQEDEPATADLKDVDIQDNINAFNLSLVIGLGLEYSLGGSTTAVVAVTFKNGFLDVLDAGNQKAVSNSLGLTLGVLF